jgi:hypothetical protein
MVKLTKDEQGLLERLSAEGKVTALSSGEIKIAKGWKTPTSCSLCPMALVVR